MIGLLGSVFVPLVLGSVSCQDAEINTIQQTSLRFYFGSFYNYTELPLEKAHEIQKTPWYNPNKTCIIYTFGFTGQPTGPAVTAVLTTFIAQGIYNVALLNWQYLASQIDPNLSTSYFSWAAPNVKKVGVSFADTLINLSNTGVDLSKIHLIGHSLGAHAFGITGNILAARGILLPRITGLDPAQFSYETKPPGQRLSPYSAQFVAVIHSDPSKYGYKRSLGTVDFWPNYRMVGPVIQPGCTINRYPMFSKEDLCNHNRCWELLVDAIKYPGTIIGCYAKNFRAWKNRIQSIPILLDINNLHPNIVPGNYFFVTNALSPFGLGVNGIYPMIYH